MPVDMVESVPTSFSPKNVELESVTEIRNVSLQTIHVPKIVDYERSSEEDLLVRTPSISSKS